MSREIDLVHLICEAHYNRNVSYETLCIQIYEMKKTEEALLDQIRSRLDRGGPLLEDGLKEIATLRKRIQEFCDHVDEIRNQYDEACYFYDLLKKLLLLNTTP
jgi:hypothetical protein